MFDLPTFQQIDALGLSSETAANTYVDLRRLAEANGEEVQAIDEFLLKFPAAQRSRYVAWFRPDDLLSHFRTWKDKCEKQERFWIRVMESRTNKKLLKIWLLGEDRILLAGCFGSLLRQRGIDIEEEFGTVAPGEFAILSVHVKKEEILKQFGGPVKDIKSSMGVLAWCLKDGLDDFFSTKSSKVEISWWLNPHYFFKLRAGAGYAQTIGQTWLRAFDIQGSSDRALGEIWLLCLLFSCPLEALFLARRQAARKFCHLAPELPQEAISSIRSALVDDDTEVRLNCTQALGKMGLGAIRAISDIIARLKDPSPSVARSAIRALGMIPDSRGILSLTEIVSKHESLECRMLALDALGQLGSHASSTFPVLIDALRANSSEVIRGAAAWALGQVQALHADVIAALDVAARDDPAPSVRRLAIDSRARLSSLSRPANDLTSVAIDPKGQRLVAQYGQVFVYAYDSLGHIQIVSPVTVNALCQLFDQDETLLSLIKNEEMRGWAALIIDRSIAKQKRRRALRNLFFAGPGVIQVLPVVFKVLAEDEPTLRNPTLDLLTAICPSLVPYAHTKNVQAALSSSNRETRLATIHHLVTLSPECTEVFTQAIKAMKGQEVHHPSDSLLPRPVPAENQLEYIESEFLDPSAFPRPKGSPASNPSQAIEQDKHSLPALLARSRSLVAEFTSLVQKAREGFSDDPKAVAAVMEPLREAYLLFFSKLPTMPALMPASPASLEPTIDLSGNVPEQVNQLCLWFRAQMADAETADGAERERRRGNTIAKFQTQINTLIGGTFGAEGNAAIVKVFREMLKATKYRVKCQCNFPGLPYYQLAQRSNAANGAFQIIHYYKGGQTYHGGPATFPGYTIVPAPATVAARRPPAPSRKHSR